MDRCGVGRESTSSAVITIRRSEDAGGAKKNPGDTGHKNMWLHTSPSNDHRHRAGENENTFLGPFLAKNKQTNKDHDNIVFVRCTFSVFCNDVIKY